MRRFAIGMLISAIVAVVFVCGASAFLAAQPPQGLVLEGATNLTVQRLSFGRQRISYTMPAGKTVSNLRQSLNQYGWQRLQRLDEDLGVQFYVRSFINKNVRVIVSVHRPVTRRDPVVIEIAQCLRLGDRVLCL